MSVAVLVTHARCSLPAGIPWVELPRFLVRSFHFSSEADMHPPFCTSEVGLEPVDGSTRRRLEFTEIGIEVSAFDDDQSLGLERALVCLESQIGYGDLVVVGNHHQKRRRRYTLDEVAWSVHTGPAR